MSHATFYELDRATMLFGGPRAMELEVAYQEKLLELGWNAALSRRQWYDANIWSPHKNSIKNPFHYIWSKGDKLST
jgi:hypothetical protein